MIGRKSNSNISNSIALSGSPVGLMVLIISKLIQAEAPQTTEVLVEEKPKQKFWNPKTLEWEVEGQSIYNGLKKYAEQEKNEIRKILSQHSVFQNKEGPIQIVLDYLEEGQTPRP